MKPFHVMAKPVGPICNLDCTYCYYLEKKELYPDALPLRMSEETLAAFVRQYIEAQPGPDVHFMWQGGEPTLMGLDFFRRVVALQQACCPSGWRITNAIQTNGTLLNAQWCRFFAEHQFLVGISIDGPAELHDHYRVDTRGRGSHDRVLHGLHLLQEHGVEYNVLCVVNSLNAAQPLAIYHAFKTWGVTHIQFIALVEREQPAAGAPTHRSVAAAAFGEFLVRIFDEWIRQDVGKVYVQIFEEAFRITLGYPSTLCIFSETCGAALAMEHNGDLYACDHYVLPEYRLGNLQVVPVDELVQSPEQTKFGQAKRDGLPRYCLDCSVRHLCHGECPKNRFIHTPTDEPGLNYLCAGYKRFFTHAEPYLRRMASLYRRGLPAARIMQDLAAEDARRWAAVGRNDLCPCGSGNKFKRCCMRSGPGSANSSL